MARKPTPAAGGDIDETIDQDAIYRVTLRRRGEIAPGVTIPAAIAGGAPGMARAAFRTASGPSARRAQLGVATAAAAAPTRARRFSRIIAVSRFIEVPSYVAAARRSSYKRFSLNVASGPDDGAAAT